MSKYTVVITREEPGATDARCPRLTMYIDTGAPGPRVTGVAVSTQEAEGLTAENIPRVDLAAVVEALAARLPAENGRPQRYSPESSRVAPSGAEPAGRSAAPDMAGPATVPSSPAAHSAEPVPGRAYRKMPDPAELRENLQKIGTVTGLAKYYGVPRHTAQGWVGRLRKADSAQQSAVPEVGDLPGR
ncbi:hypothetical protein [Nocardia sp. X0981]